MKRLRSVLCLVTCDLGLWLRVLYQIIKIETFVESGLKQMVGISKFSNVTGYIKSVLLSNNIKS